MDIDALDVGLGYALAGTLVDDQTRKIEAALAGLEQPLSPPLDSGPIEVQITEPDIPAHDHSPLEAPRDWHGYVGQEKVKRTMLVHATSAKTKGARLPHTLLASNRPGVGKTHMSRLCASLMGVRQFELVPPFNIYTIVEAIQQLRDKDILFIDEIHKLSDNGAKGSEILLKILEEGWAPLPSGEIVHLPDVSLVAATTDRGRLPRTVIDRFKIKPTFEKYTLPQLAEIAVIMASRHRVLDIVTNELACTIAKACRDTPRITEEMVMAVSAMFDSYAMIPSSAELLEFLDTEPDGMGPEHITYLTALRTFFRRETKKGVVEYISGEPSLRSLVRVDKDDLVWVEQFLIEKGCIDKTPQGRRLTEDGIARAEAFIDAGKGVTRG